MIDKCNCRDKVRCPLDGKCKLECVVYKVEVYSHSNNKRNKNIYFGSTQGDFKTRSSSFSLATIVEGDPKAPFSIATTPRCRGGRYSIPWIASLYP